MKGGNLWEGFVCLYLFLASLSRHTCGRRQYLRSLCLYALVYSLPISEDWKYHSEDPLCCTGLLAHRFEEENLLMKRIWQINMVYYVHLGNRCMDYSRISIPPYVPSPFTKGCLEEVQCRAELAFCPSVATGGRIFFTSGNRGSDLPLMNKLPLLLSILFFFFLYEQS